MNSQVKALSMDMLQGQPYELPPLSEYIVIEHTVEEYTAKALESLLDSMFD